MKAAAKIGIGLGLLSAIGLLIWAKAGSAVNFVKNLTFAPLWYGGINDMKISTSGVKLPLAVDLGNRSDQKFKIRINAVDIYKDGSKIASSNASREEVVLEPYSTQRAQLDIVVGWSFLSDLGLSVINISGGLNKLMDALQAIKLRVDLTINDKIQSPFMVDFQTGEVTMDGLGLVPSATHLIGDKRDYLHLIPSASKLNHADKILITDVTPEQTAAFIRRLAKRCKWQTATLANALKGSNEYDTVRRIFDFVYKYIAYTADSSQNEQVRTPLRTLHDQKGDCDCMTALIASLFENLGIKYAIRITEYNGKGYFQHVYAVAYVGSQEVPCDPVWGTFGTEKQYTNKKNF